MFICLRDQDSTMPHRRKKSHALRNALVAIIVLIVIISIVVVARQMNSNRLAGPPEYSTVSSSSTNAGSSCTFSVLWMDDAKVSGYIFETNNTGAFVNDTWTPFSDFVTQTSAYANVTKPLNSTIGTVVSWRFWANDTNGNWTGIPLQNLFVDSNKVLLVTSMGNITIELFGDMPITTKNFKYLVENGVYDGTIFHRVVPDFVIQGGDPTSKGITVPTIPDENIGLHSNVRGTVAMAKTNQANSARSQFFINLNNTNAFSLDSNFSVFGRVVAGMDIADKISLVPVVQTTDQNKAGYQKPVTDVTLISAQFVN
jgi:peptidylprolyl isomerase